MLIKLRRWCTKLKTALVERHLLAVNGREYLRPPFPFSMVIFCLFKFIYLNIIANIHMTTTCFVLHVHIYIGEKNNNIQWQHNYIV